ncbi:hypothetical protein MASR2M74_00250 [Paracoccaceae bacterium]
MIYNEITAKLEANLKAQNLDALVLANPQNIQYATGVRIAPAQAQPGLAMLALIVPGQRPVVIVPDAWIEAAALYAYDATIQGYGTGKQPIEAALAEMAKRCDGILRAGIDDDSIPVCYSDSIHAALSSITLIPCAGLLVDLRATKTSAEIAVLSDIALKNDHVINGYLHHMIADRAKSAMSIAEGLRVHSLERDIPLQGYNACCRASVGVNLVEFWPDAPQFGFAGCMPNKVGDPMLAEAVNTQHGYWSNATRLAINADEMSAIQIEAYGKLVRLRELLCNALRAGRTGAEVHAEIVKTARDEKLSLVETLPVGFSVGVSAYERPFLSAGEVMTLRTGMVLVLDPVVAQDGLHYRSRDTVVLGDTAPEVVGWYKDWREPYMALPSI